MAVNIAIIGYGAIAGFVAQHLPTLGEVNVSGVLARSGRENNAARVFGEGPQIATSIDQLDKMPDLVVECAGHGAVQEHGLDILSRGVPLAIISIGALAHDNVAAELEAAALAGQTQLTLVSGAIGAIDALSAARVGGLEKVSYKSRKPAMAWMGTKAEEEIDLAGLTKASVFFAGCAREAAQVYPKNANVAATVALAGLGLDNTAVALIAEPDSLSNIHEIEAVGAFGSFSFAITGNPLAGNPKSSALTAMSVVRYLRNVASPIRI